jgi:hypothetical protein
MKKTYQGGCHCGAVRYAADIDLSQGSIRCNCGFCQRARFWFAIVKAEDFRLLAGEEALTDYQHTPEGKASAFLHFTFCSRCGFRPFTRGGVLPQLGPFYAVNVACIDGLSPEELAQIPINFLDGKNDNFTAPPRVHSYL